MRSANKLLYILFLVALFAMPIFLIFNNFLGVIFLSFFLSIVTWKVKLIKKSGLNLEKITFFNLLAILIIFLINFSLSPIYYFLTLFVLASILFLSKKIVVDRDKFKTKTVVREVKLLKSKGPRLKEVHFRIILAIVLLAYLAFGLNHLGEFMTVDEPKWLYTRTVDYYQGLINLDFSLTYINDKPGVLPAILSGPINLLYDVNEFGPQEFKNFLFLWRLPILIFNFFALILIAYFSKKLFNNKTVILLISFFALSPTIVGLSQIVNPDSTVWSTTFLAFLTFLIFIKSNKSKYLIYTGLFMGLALLSKYSAIICFPLFFLIVYFKYLFSSLSQKELVDKIVSIFYLFLISGFVYLLFLPASWLNPEILISGTVGGPAIRAGMCLFLILLLLSLTEVSLFKGIVSSRIIDYIQNKEFKVVDIVIGLAFLIFAVFALLFVFGQILDLNIFKYNLFVYEEFEKRETGFWPVLTYSLYSLVFSLNPVVLLALIIAPFVFLVGKLSERFSNFEKIVILCSVLLIGAFYFGVSLAGIRSTIRYQVIILPLLYIISGLILTKFIKKSHWLILVIVLSFYPLADSQPFYYNYSNFLNVRNKLISDNWGYGGYELAQELNKKPQAEKLSVWTDREGFAEFFIGNSYFRNSINPFKAENEIDYLILTKRGKLITTNYIEECNNLAFSHPFDLERATIICSPETQALFLKYFETKGDCKVMITDSTQSYVEVVPLKKEDLIY